MAGPVPVFKKKVQVQFSRSITEGQFITEGQEDKTARELQKQKYLIETENKVGARELRTKQVHELKW